MSLFPFSHQLDDTHRTVGDVSDEHKKLTQEDEDYVKYMIDYRKNTGWDEKAKRGMLVYNVLQTFTSEDEVSEIFLGYSRMIIDKGIEQMTEGEPDFDFEPLGPSDHMKTIMWKHLIKKILSDSEYKLHQGTFFRDYFVMGNGVFEVFIDYPERTIRISDGKGGFDSVVVADYRRPKVGVRAVNPMNCWRNPNVDTPSQVPSCLRKRRITWNQFAQSFGRCEGKGFINLDKIAGASHVELSYLQDEIRDVYRIYAKPYGKEIDGKASIENNEYQLGALIFDSSLKIHEKMKDGIVLQSTGMNIPGICSLRWGTFFDKYDDNYSGEHQVYGMGLPERIEGEDTVLQTMFNMNIDNARYANTFALNYQGNNADSYVDTDANRLYGGEVIDGQITPMPLGISRLGDFQVMTEILDRHVIPSVAINHQQMVGDTSKTAFEFAQRIRMANRGAEQRLKRLEAEVFKPVGQLLLANALTTLTVDDYEAMTEGDVEVAKQQIKEGKRTAEDFKDLNTSKPLRKVLHYLPMKGEKIREDFSTTKKRKLDYNAEFTAEGKTTNTLRRDEKMPVDTSYIPLVKEYVYPTEYIEQGLLPDVVVDSKRMLGDMKAQDVQNFQAATNFILQLLETGYDKLDTDKLVQEVLRFANIDDDRILKTDQAQSHMAKLAKHIISKLEEDQLQQIDQPAEGVQMPQVEQGGSLDQLANATI